jgi:hypothetical protein
MMPSYSFYTSQIYCYLENKIDAIKTIDQFGKYFYDKNLCEANLRKLRGLALMTDTKDLKSNGEAIEEFLNAKLLFEQYSSSLGQAI